MFRGNNYFLFFFIISEHHYFSLNEILNALTKRTAGKTVTQNDSDKLYIIGH